MKISFTPTAWTEYLWWQTHDRKMLKRINTLIRDITRDDDSGIGKPELLRNDLTGFSSRRINDQHRLVYRVDGDELAIVQCRYHYEDR